MQQKKVKLFQAQEVEKIPGFLVWQLGKLWQRQLELAFKDLALSHTQAILLANILRLKQAQKNITQILLSEETKVDPMTTSQTLKSLMKKKLITRTISQEDRRAFYIVPTREGKKVAFEVIRRLPNLQNHFFNSLGNEVDTFVLTLQKLVESNKMT